MTDKSKKTIRILFPQWQGGNQELYGFGARLLHWLSPESRSPLHTISVPEFNPDTPEPEQGCFIAGSYSASMMRPGQCWKKKNRIISWCLEVTAL